MRPALITFLSLSLSFSHPVGRGSRSDSSDRDGHPFPSSPCFCSRQLHCPLLTKWAYLTPHPMAQMNNSPCRCTAGEVQAGLHLTEHGQWIMGLSRGAPLPACPRESTSNCSWAHWSLALVERHNAGTIARIVYMGKKKLIWVLYVLFLYQEASLNVVALKTLTVVTQWLIQVSLLHT